MIIVCLYISFDLSQDSVVVTFDLRFNQVIDRKEAELQLRAGLQDSRRLVIDRNSIKITGEVTGHTVRSEVRGII